MRSQRLAQKLPLAIPVLLVLLLAGLATLQYHWSGKVSTLERQRMRTSLFVAGSHFSEDFDREITRVFLFFHPDPQGPAGGQLDRVARQYDHWMAEAPYPRLVRDVFLIRPRGSVAKGTGLEVLRPADHRFAPTPWPPELAAVQRHLAEDPPLRGGFGIGSTLGEVPGLVIPLAFPRPPGAGEPADPADSLAGAYLVVRLDWKTITGEILPGLTRQYFSSPQGVDYAVAVRETADPRRFLFLSDPRMTPAAFGAGDLHLGMFNLRPFEELRSLSTEREMGGNHLHSPAPHLPAGLRSHFGLGPPPGDRSDRHHRRDLGDWQLLVKHRDGTLEEAVAAVRRRNLAISLGILALLGATAGMMFVTTQRAQRLARQQIEFVAGVTHELNTPLTAIRSAGQNLADGVVADPGQVKRYGALIESEGRRLSDMVGQALDFAGIQSGRRVYHPRPVDVGEVVDGALQDCRWLLQEKQIRVEREVEPGLPSVLVDAAALRRAIANLVENAVKYGGRAAWIGIRVRRSPSGPVEITVADRGPGIRREDLPKLFEPFFRGRDAATAGVPGSGLGLSLVRHIAEAHGGRVTVTTGVGEGAAFTLQLPAEDGAETVEGVEAPA
jgi:signal transduction histidine kinase